MFTSYTGMTPIHLSVSWMDSPIFNGWRVTKVSLLFHSGLSITAPILAFLLGFSPQPGLTTLLLPEPKELLCLPQTP